MLARECELVHEPVLSQAWELKQEQEPQLSGVQSLLLDPLTSSLLTIDETRQMVDELFAAGKNYLKGYK